MVTEISQLAGLVEVEHAIQRFIADVRILVRGERRLLLGVILHVLLAHQEVDEFASLGVMLRMRADRQHHVVAGGQLLFLDVVGGRHLREPQIGVLVDQTDLRNRVRAERQNRGLAGSDVLRTCW